MQSSGQLADDTCINDDSHPGSQNSLLSSSNNDFSHLSCLSGQDPHLVSNLRSDIQEILYGSPENESASRDRVLVQLSNNTELLTDDLYAGHIGSPVFVRSDF